MKVSHDVTKVFISFETNASLNGADSAIFHYLLFLWTTFFILTSSTPKIGQLERFASLKVVPIDKNLRNRFENFLKFLIFWLLFFVYFLVLRLSKVLFLPIRFSESEERKYTRSNMSRNFRIFYRLFWNYLIMSNSFFVE